MEEINSLAIGVRELDDNQIKNILPGYENIYTQIKSIREYAKSCNDKCDIMVNNVFSILGKRGAGKSSILKSLRKKIIDESKGDIVLPILMPSILQGNNDMMGWILGSLEDEIIKLCEVELHEKKSKEGYSNSFINCRMNTEETEIYRQYSEVLRKYRYTREDYADILKENYSGLKEYIDKTKRILDPENNLKNSFYKFIDKAIKLKKLEKKNIEPMLFIFLDDIDLAKNCSHDILGVCARYLSHPNIIIFISGDYNMFETEQFLSYMESSDLKELIVSPKENNYLGNKLINDNKQLAKDTLKKIMPPAYRYNLRILSPKERLNFYYGDNPDNTIKKLFEEKFKRLDKDDNKSDCLDVINAYGLILDDMPRGIMNVYYALSNMDDNSILGNEEIEEEKKNYISQFRILLDTIIRSSSVLNKYEKEINMCIQINDKFDETFFNHERLIAQIQGENKDKKNIDDMMIVLIFAHFIESIVQLVSKNRKIHGQKEAWKLVEDKEIKEKKFKIYPQINDIDIIFELYESMLSNDALNIMQTMDNIYLKDFSVKFYFDQLEKIDKMSKDKINVSKIGIEDSEWMEEKYKIIFYHCDPLCLMFNKGINIVKEQLKLNEDISTNNTDDQNNNKKQSYKDSFNKNIHDNFNMEFYKRLFNKEYDEMIKEELSTNIQSYKEKLLSELQTELGICEIEFEFKDIEVNTFNDINKLDKPIENYFSKLNMNKKEDEEYSDANYKIIYLAIIYNALSEIKDLGDYELRYFECFKGWHNKLKDKSVYKEWYEKRREISPLTLVLEND